MTGSNPNDLGLILERGSTGNNVFIGWDESTDKVMVATTTADGTATGNLSLTAANFQAADVTMSSATSSGKITINATEGLEVGGIRGRAIGNQTGDFIQMYERVHIGYPNGWGATQAAAPTQGLSTWGSINVGTSGSGVLQIGGTTVIDASQNLTNIGTISSGAITSTGNIEVRSGNKLILQRPNNGIASNISTDSTGAMVLDSLNSEGFFFNNAGTNAFKLDPINATFAGTISSGAITVNHSSTPNISLSPTSTGGVINARNSSGTSVAVMDGRGTPFIDVTGNLKTGGTTRIDSSGNLSNIASLDLNGNATVSGSITFDGTAVYNALNMANNNIVNVNNISISDPGPNEGVQWSNIKIFESPNDLTTNSSGNFQVVYGSTRRLTVNSTGIDVNGRIDLTNGGYLSFYGNGSEDHSIGAYLDDDIRINSYGGVFISLDSNGNNDSAADFLIGKHAGASTAFGTNDQLFKIRGDGRAGDVITVGNIGLGATLSYPKIAYPGSEAQWSASGTSTGQVIIDLPGTLNNYDMMYMEIDIYEYSGEAGSKIIFGGHNWNSGGDSGTSNTMWHNTDVKIVGEFSKSIYVGWRNNGSVNKRVIVLGEPSSTWSYGSVHVSKVHGANLFYQTGIDWTGDWNVTQSTSSSAYNKSPSTNFNASDRRVLRVHRAIQGQRVYGDTDIRSPIFYDLDDTTYRIDAASTSKLKYLDIGNTDSTVGVLKVYDSGNNALELKSTGSNAFRFDMIGTSATGQLTFQDLNIDISGGHLQHFGTLYSRANLQVLNAAGNGWHTWATRSNGKFSLSVEDISTTSHGTSANWKSAYDNYITGIGVSGTTTKTITLTQRDGGTISTTFTDLQGSSADGVVDSLSFSAGTVRGGTSGTGVLTLGRSGSLSDLTVDLDGRYLQRQYMNNWTRVGYGDSGTNKWHKLCTITITGAYQDYNVGFFWTDRYDRGEASIHVHSDNDTTADVWAARFVSTADSNRKAASDVMYTKSGSTVEIFVKTPSWREFDYIRNDAVTEGTPSITWYDESTTTEYTSQPSNVTAFTDMTPISQSGYNKSFSGNLEDKDNTQYYLNPADTSVINQLDVATNIRHNGDTDTYIQFTTGEIDFFANGRNGFMTSSGGFVVNPGLHNYDFIVRGDNESNLIYGDASADSVGIGTATPKAKLHIGPLSGGNGTAQERLRISGDYTATGSGSLIRFTNQHDSGTNPNSGEYNIAGIKAFDFRSDWGGALALQTAPNTSAGGNLTDRLVINPEGDVGINTSNPASFLHVHGTQSYGTVRISPTSTNGESAMAFFLDTNATTTGTAWVVGHAPWGNTGDFVIGNQAFGGPVMLMQQDGKVGIGTDSPSAHLHIENGSGATLFMGDTNGRNLRFRTANSSSQVSNISSYAGLYLGGADNQNHMMIDGNGKVGIGTNSPAEKLDVLGKINVQNGQVWDGTTQGTGRGSIHIDPNSATDHAGGAITFGASDTGNGTSSHAGIYVRSDGSYGTRMYLSTTDSYGTGSKSALYIDQAGIVRSTRTRIESASDMRASIFYDRDNTSYFLDAQNTGQSMTVAGSITVAANTTSTQFYSNGWFRNNNSGHGLYNQNTGQHWYSDHDDYWNIAGGGSANGIRFRDDHGSTVRGYVYADSGNAIGFLDSDAQWAVRHKTDSHTEFRVNDSEKVRINGSGLQFSHAVTDNGHKNAIQRVSNLGGANLLTAATDIARRYGSGSQREFRTFVDGNKVPCHYSQGVNNSGSCYQWISTEWVDIDPEKDYEYSIWVQADGDHNIYVGWHERNASGSQITSNPYMHTTTCDTNGGWVKITARLKGHRTPSGNADSEGTDRFATDPNYLDRGTGVASADGVMHSTTRQIMMRFGTCYGTANTAKTYFYLPCIREISYENAQQGFILPNIQNGTVQAGRLHIGTTSWSNYSGIEYNGGSGSQEFRMSSDSGDLNLRVDGWGLFHGAEGLQADKFQDINNAAYFLKPADTSNLHHTDFNGMTRVISGSIGENTSTTTKGFMFDGNYTNGQYRHRFRKQDKGGGVPLYLDYAAGTANSYTPIARFGPWSNNPENFEVFGSARVTGSLRINAGSSDYTGQTNVDESILRMQTDYDGAGSQNLQFVNHNGNWLDGTSGADSAFGWMWSHGNSQRAGIIYDHRSTEKFDLYSSYGEIRFRTPASANGNLSPIGTESSMPARLTIGVGGAVTASNDMRAPIFYASNNTSYYVDPYDRSFYRLGNPSSDSDATGRRGLSWYHSMGPDMTLWGYGSASGVNAIRIWAAAGASSTVAGDKFEFKHDGSLHADGDITAFSTTTTSDIRLKENVRDLEGSLDKTLQLRGVKFDWKEESKGNDQLGFIAQEIEEVLPEVVNEVDSLNTTDEKYKVVNYSAVVPVLVEAIKELKAEIDELKEQLKKK